MREHCSRAHEHTTRLLVPPHAPGLRGMESGAHQTCGGRTRARVVIVFMVSTVAKGSEPYMLCKSIKSAWPRAEVLGLLVVGWGVWVAANVR